MAVLHPAQELPAVSYARQRLLRLKVTDTLGRRITRKRAALRIAAKLAFFEIGHLSFLFPTPLFSESNPHFRLSL
jgi:hypothetical protein